MEPNTAAEAESYEFRKLREYANGGKQTTVPVDRRVYDQFVKLFNEKVKHPNHFVGESFTEFTNWFLDESHDIYAGRAQVLIALIDVLNAVPTPTPTEVAAKPAIPEIFGVVKLLLSEGEDDDLSIDQSEQLIQAMFQYPEFVSKILSNNSRWDSTGKAEAQEALGTFFNGNDLDGDEAQALLGYFENVTGLSKDIKRSYVSALRSRADQIEIELSYNED